MKLIQTGYATLGSEQPFSTISLDFLQGSTKETNTAYAAGLIQSMNATPINPTKAYPIAGVFTDAGVGVTDISEGYIYYNGELFYSVAASLPISAGYTFSAYIYDNYDPSINPVQFSDYTTYNNIHDYRQIRWTNTATGSFYYSDMVRLTSVPSQVSTSAASIVAAYTAADAGLTALIDIENWTSVSTFGTGWSSGGAGATARFRKDGKGRISLDGNANFGGTYSNTTIFTLPAGYRPTQTIYCVVYGDSYDSGTMETTLVAIFLAITPSGLVLIQNANQLTTPPLTFVSLSGVPLFYNS